MTDAQHPTPVVGVSGRSPDVAVSGVTCRRRGATGRPRAAGVPRWVLLTDQRLFGCIAGAAVVHSDCRRPLIDLGWLAEMNVTLTSI